MVIRDFERRHGSRRPGRLALTMILVLVPPAGAQSPPLVDRQVEQAGQFLGVSYLEEAPAAP